MNSIDPQHKVTLGKAFWFYGVGFLGCLYWVAFITVYTPWGRELGIAFPSSFFHAKIVFVSLACSWFVFRVYRVLASAALSYEGPRIYAVVAKIFVLLTAAVLLVGTPYVALILGYGYTS